MFCPECKGEYVKGVTRCKQCDVPLVASLPEDPKRLSDESDIDFVSVVRTFNPQDIAIIESILEESGIEYYIQGKNGIMTYPLVDPASIMVVKGQAEQARELLKDLDLSYYFYKPDREQENQPDDGSSSEVNDAESEEET
jgi:hypothetical protein